MRESSPSANYISRPDPLSPRHSPRHSVRPQPSYTSVFQNFGNGPSRQDILQGPLIEGFPHHNATPRDIGTGRFRARNTLTKNTAAVERRDSSRQQQQQRPVAGFQRQRTGGLFIEAPSPSPPSHQDRNSHSEGLDSLVQSRPPATDPADLPPLSAGVPSRGLFSKTRGHYVVAEKEVEAKEPARGKGRRRDSSAGKQSEDQNRILPVVAMSDKGDRVYEHAEKTRGATRGQKIKRHCARWWWVHALIFAAITVLVVCLIIFVAVPRIAQQRVNGATLTIQGIILSQAQSENFTMAINSTLRADDSIHAVIDPFEGVMYLEDWEPQTPFARLQFPQTTSATESAVNLTQFIDILDMNAFTVFNTWVLVNESLRVSVEGDTHLKVSGISRKYPVHFKKVVTLKGLNNFNGTTVPESRVQLTPDSNGDNFFGTVAIPNVSLLTFDIGNTTFINYLQGQDIGRVFVDNMVVRPGINNFSMHANISQTPILQVIQERPFCEDGVLPMQLRGANVVNNGQFLSYYNDSLASTNQSVSIDVGADLTALGLTINCSNNRRSLPLYS
ncbi:hypothetical protein J7T55_010911 [Diaporthe amygdali]|uniref:uncharacterized protein n=1 Tax=Phomopsis amygdali TaxID=1214568 RepID=UPI0022FE90B1|nr:uncharacterized protein J7T55_010911 [Diaporthe amygdali]KAJ0104445.1 hypothetical protein J7T55_010911 [Diaporthe amygdali]